LSEVLHEKRRNREALWLTLAMWGITYPVFLLPSLAGHSSLAPWKAGAFALAVLLGVIASPPLYLLVRRTETVRARPRVLVLGAAVLVASVLVSLADALIFIRGYQLFEPAHEIPPLLKVTAGNLLIYLWLFALYVTALGLMGTTRTVEERERQLAEARADAHQAQLAALRFQLNPHFLFNTLNAISSLIVTRRNEEAETMMQKLSEFLRASLGSDPCGVISLDDELETVQAYLDIESVRFGERLAVEVICPPALLDAAVPSFLLQPLAENAVKYAVAPARRTVTVRITAAQDGDDLVLTVEDDGDAAERVNTRAGSGVGLQNVRRRLEVLYGPRGVLEALPRDGGFLAIVRLPLTRSEHLREAAE
jgi:sensor histidine kinase YesM